jgi:hypothetical protein
MVRAFEDLPIGTTAAQRNRPPPTPSNSICGTQCSQICLAQFDGAAFIHFFIHPPHFSAHLSLHGTTAKRVLLL